MNPLLTAAASYAGGKLASWLTPSQSGAARRYTDDQLARLDGYRGGFDRLGTGGQDALDRYTPRLDASIDGYSNYLQNPLQSDAENAALIGAETDALNMDARRAAARVARGLPVDSEFTGAGSGAMVGIEDQRLAQTASARSRITDANLIRKERSKQALVELMASQVARGKSDFLTGLQGGQGITSQALQVALGREDNASRADAATLGGWQSLASDLAKSYAGGTKSGVTN